MVAVGQDAGFGLSGNCTVYTIRSEMAAAVADTTVPAEQLSRMVESLRLSPSYSVLIKVIAGKGLAPKDSDGKSDPYVKIKWFGAKQKTTVVKHTLDPVWGGQEIRYHFKQEQVDAGASFDVTVWDHDRFSRNDYMGGFALPLRRLMEGDMSGEEWFPLLEQDDHRGEQVSGAVQLSWRVSSV